MKFKTVIYYNKHKVGVDGVNIKCDNNSWDKHYKGRLPEAKPTVV